MRNIDTIVIHCAATREGVDIDAATIRNWHTQPVSKGGRGWNDIGYHYVIRLSGYVQLGRPLEVIGAHVAGFNTGSIGIVYVGGVNGRGVPADTRTPVQIDAMATLVRDLCHRFPTIKRICGHRDLSPDRDGDGVVEPNEWLKACPSFDVAAWLKIEGIVPPAARK